MRKLLFIIASCLIAAAYAQAATIPSYRTDSRIEGLNEPTRIAADTYGNIYVSDSLAKTVNKIYNGSTGLLATGIVVGKPLGIAVSGGKLYVGDDSNGSVLIFTINYDGGGNPTSFTSSGSLGKGAGEFKMPNAIGISAKKGRVYVLDSNAHIQTDASTGQTSVDPDAYHIKVYDTSGNPLTTLSFGKYGKGDGQFEFPADLFVDDPSSTIYAGDNISGKIQYFDFDGQFKGSFGGGAFGNSDSKIVRLQGLHVDTKGKVYAVDAFQSEVKVFTQTGDYLTKVGKFGKGAGELDHPIGVTVNKDGKLYVTSSNSEKIEIYGLDNLQVSPESLSFKATEGGANPAAQSITLSAEDPAHPVTWTAATKSSDSWITLDKTIGTTPSTLGVSVNIAGMKPSETSYVGTITISVDSKTVATININLKIDESPVAIVPILSVLPDIVTFDGMVDGAQPAAKSISIANQGAGTLSWQTAVTYEDSKAGKWLNLSKTSGSSNANINLSVDTRGLAAASYRANIDIKDASAKNSPLSVTVILNLVKATQIKVTTNSTEAVFVLSGPETYTGSGMEWTKENAPEGIYTITYGKVNNLITPQNSTLQLNANSSIAFNGQYDQMKKLNSIIVGSGEQAAIRVFDGAGESLVKSFSPFTTGSTVKVAAGDIDGDGNDEIISTLWGGAGTRPQVVISNKDGAKIASFRPMENEYGFGYTVAAADIDGDGMDEIIVGSGPGDFVPARVRVYKYKEGRIQDAGPDFLAYDGGYGVNVAGGDTDGSGYANIITAPGPNPAARGEIKIWRVDTTGGFGKWKIMPVNTFDALNSRYGATVATGDMDGDGKLEIVVGAGPGSDNDAHVKVFKGDGSPFGLEFIAGSWRYGVNVAAGSVLSSDGIAEIVVTPGYGQKNQSVVRIFDTAGELRKEFNAFETKHGANITLGGFK